MTYHFVDVADVGQKSTPDVKGRRDFKVYQKEFKIRLKVLKESLESWKIQQQRRRKKA